MDSKPVLFSCGQMTDLAHQIHGEVKGEIDLGSLSASYFADGFPHIQLWSTVRGRDVAYLASFNNPHTIFEQLAVIYALPRYEANSLTVLLPFFSVGTMDRVDMEGEIATAMTMARMLSATPACHGTGPARIVIADIHSLQERFYFHDTVVPKLVTAIPLLRKRLTEMFGKEVAIAFPDAGAYKRFKPQFDGYPLIICEKKRDGEKREVRIVGGYGYAEHHHVVIVDDLIMSGGTVRACRDALVAAKARTVSVYATHGVFPNESWRKFKPEQFANAWITDSCPQTVHDVRNVKPFEIISLAPLISGILLERRNRT